MSHTHTHACTHTHIPGQIPDFADVVQDVALAGGDHLVGDLDKQRGHALGGVVVRRDAVDHADGVHQTRDVVHHLRLQDKTQH